jgi:hypothetical protein
VEKIAIPILHHEIAHCWDMLSTQETKNAISATSLVINYVPATSEALSELLAAIRTRLADAVASTVVHNFNLEVIFEHCRLAHTDTLPITLIALLLLIFCITGPNMEPACAEGCAECCTSCSVPVWNVCSFDEEYLLVERYPGIASS